MKEPYDVAVLLQPATPAYDSAPLASLLLASFRARAGVQHAASLLGAPISCQITQLLPAIAVPYS